MATSFPLTEKERIEVGKPLPFSIFTADGKLLLAAGRVVESERLREMLTQNGHVRGSSESGSSGGSGGGGSGRGGRGPRDSSQREEDPGPAETSLSRMRRDYDASNDGHRLAISIARNETDKAYTVQLLGANGNTFIITAPVNTDGTLVAVLAGQAWLCRTFQVTSAFRFNAVATKVAFEPFPYLHLRLQRQVEQRKVRGAPRAKVSVSGELLTPEPMSCVVSDLSATGARIAIEADKILERGQAVRLVTTLQVLRTKYPLTLEGTVINALGPSDARYSDVAFYGIKFNAPTEMDSLVLHGFVSAHLLAESHGLWQMLTLASGPERTGP